MPYTITPVQRHHDPITIQGDPHFLEPIVLRDLIVDIHEPCDYGISIEFPEAPSVVWPSVVLDNVTVRGPATTGIRLRNCWNASLMNVFVSGVLTEQSRAQLANATMKVGIDLGGSMDVHIVNPRVTCAHTGILVEDYALPGHGEGLHVSGGFVMHAAVGVRLKGFGSGGWPTPNSFVRDMHLCCTDNGIFATRYTGIHITDNDCYTEQLDAQFWGVYLADGCTEATIVNNRFWDNRPGHLFSGAVVLDACQDVLLSGQLSHSLSLGLWATQSCSRVTNRLVSAPNVPNFDHSQK